jgi:hypothetical protein
VLVSDAFECRSLVLADDRRQYSHSIRS